MTLLEVLLAALCFLWAAEGAAAAESQAFAEIQLSDRVRAAVEAADAVAERYTAGDTMIPSSFPVNGYTCQVEVRTDAEDASWVRIEASCQGTVQTVWVRRTDSDG
ncbi:hypothetical protein [Alicyclobacillus shizuokensis]|uniref:hypothetical protein n=1 Tax=Alicyclobacillus shizuokensis TaxID=392014 RepID=UPI00082CA1A3|nr:hypothetical protein [Alicyclobacillus shizuokensis]MCL6625388.1 hypothetical protein [Alicyclobacillus shizuokensis]